MPPHYTSERFPPRFVDDAVERAFREHVPTSVRALISGGMFTAAAASH